MVADSAQFSISVAEHAPLGLAGTMLMVQTCIGFALTLPVIHFVPWLAERAGWGWAFAVLAIGPALGCVAMAWLVPGRPGAAADPPGPPPGPDGGSRLRFGPAPRRRPW